MAVKIRLKRFGKKRQAIYRVVVQDSRVKRDGKVIDELGFYAPEKNKEIQNFEIEKAKAWLSKGAQLSDTLTRIFSKAGVIKEPKLFAMRKQAVLKGKEIAAKKAKAEEEKKAKGEAGDSAPKAA